MATKKKKVVKKVYKAVIKIMGKTFEAEGETALEAISGLKPDITKSKGVLTVERGDNKRERVIMGAVIWRLFNGSPFSKEVTLKQVSTLYENI